MKTYLYIGKYYDIKGRPVSINDKKIGITIDPGARENSLSNTKGPISYTFIRLWEFVSAKGMHVSQEVEKILHNFLSHRRTNGEWFSDEEEDIQDLVEDFLSRLSKLSDFQLTEVDLSGSKKVSYTEKKVIEEEKRERENRNRSIISVEIDGEKIEGNNNKAIYLNSITTIGLDRVLPILGPGKIVRIEETDKRFRNSATIDGYHIDVNFSAKHFYDHINLVKKKLSGETEISVSIGEK